MLDGYPQKQAFALLGDLFLPDVDCEVVVMSQARRVRRYKQWERYCARYITPERGGMLNVAQPIGSMKALFRVARRPWTHSDAYWARRARRSAWWNH